MARHSAACPVCGKPARQMAAKVGDYTEINRNSCGHFQASGTFQQVVSNYPAAVRLQSLERAVTRARYGSLPTVTTYDLP
jgi:hypothetical protein